MRAYDYWAGGEVGRERHFQDFTQNTLHMEKVGFDVSWVFGLGLEDDISLA